MSLSLPLSLQAWPQKDFKTTFIKEVEALNGYDLPLQQGLRWSSYALADGFRVMVSATVETDQTLDVKTGVFYKGIIAGCSCSDDPSPTDEQTEYCQMWFKIDKQTAVTKVTVIQEG
ncbi:MAG: hypothetical protein U9R28_06420 [Pseudomonadota bacterium]|nr:hypothetical protein [Pseudomonadota bacterium]